MHGNPEDLGPKKEKNYARALGLWISRFTTLGPCAPSKKLTQTLNRYALDHPGLTRMTWEH